MVEAEPRSRGGQAFVRARDEHGGTTRSSGRDARRELHASLGPCVEGSDQVSERADVTSGGGDDELDLLVEVGLGDGLDGIDQLAARLPIELAGEEHDGTIVLVGEGNLSHDAPSGRRRRRRDG